GKKATEKLAENPGDGKPPRGCGGTPPPRGGVAAFCAGGLCRRGRTGLTALSPASVPALRGPGSLALTGGFLMIESRGLVKRYGSTIAVDNLSFDVMPGTVTGFLGPNGAGKSTTMRMMLGLDRPDSGTVRI